MINYAINVMDVLNVYIVIQLYNALILFVHYICFKIIKLRNVKVAQYIAVVVIINNAIHVFKVHFL